MVKDRHVQLYYQPSRAAFSSCLRSCMADASATLTRNLMSMTAKRQSPCMLAIAGASIFSDGDTSRTCRES